MEEFKCDISGCGKTFKSLAGLEGHKRLSHSEGTKKTYPDEIGKRLERLELAGTAKYQKLDTEEGLVSTLKLLLPLMQRLKIVVLPFCSRYDDDYLELKRYRIVKDPSFSKAGFGGLVVGSGAEEL